MLIERGKKERPADRATAWWLLCRSAGGRLEALRLSRDGEEALAVFGHEEEAEMFLWSLGAGGAGDGWRARESSTGELASFLLCPCAGTKAVALDPLPGAVARRTGGCAPVRREAFLERLLGGRGRRGLPGTTFAGRWAS